MKKIKENWRIFKRIGVKENWRKRIIKEKEWLKKLKIKERKRKLREIEEN